MEKIIAVISEETETITATIKEGLIIIGTSTMDIDIITTDPIPADTDTDIEHNKGTTDIFFQLCDLDGQPRGYNTLKPKTGDEENTLIVNVGDACPSGLILKIIYKIA